MLAGLDIEAEDTCKVQQDIPVDSSPQRQVLYDKACTQANKPVLERLLQACCRTIQLEGVQPDRFNLLLDIYREP
jgi:hypothetical protein